MCFKNADKIIEEVPVEDIIFILSSSGAAAFVLEEAQMEIGSGRTQRNIT